MALALEAGLTHPVSAIALTGKAIFASLLILTTNVYVDEAGMDNREDYSYGWNEKGNVLVSARNPETFEPILAGSWEGANWELLINRAIARLGGSQSQP